MPKKWTSVERGYAPRWSWRAVGTAGTVTLLLYVGLPYLERLSAPPEPDQILRPVTAVAAPVPLQPPPEPVQPARSERPRPPELQAPQQRIALPAAHLQLQTGIGDVAGDFVLGLHLQDYSDLMHDTIFELRDLDEPPRPIVQLRPQYPPQARLRQQEGYVTVAFIVNAEGTVEEAAVVDAQPQDVFNQAALQAVARWRFSPGVRDGAAVAVRVRQRVEFRLQ